MNFTSFDIATLTGSRLMGTGLRPVAEAVLDHRLLPEAGGLFLAMVGERTDGHRFVAAAAQAGASAAIIQSDRVDELSHLSSTMDLIVANDVQKALWHLAQANREGHQVPTVAITGSSGKTTTRSLLQSGLTAVSGQGCCTRGNQNNLLGVPLTLCRLSKDDRYLVAELGSNAFGEIQQLATLVRPQIGVITLVARAHLEGFGDIHGVLKEKSALARAVPADGAVVIPSFDPLLAQAGSTWSAATVTFGYEKGDAVRIRDEKEGITVTAVVDVEGTVVKLALPVCGVFNVRNAAAALAVVNLLGGDVKTAALAMGEFRAESMRMESRQWRGCTVIVDAYNANPESMKAALATLKGLEATRKIAVLGAMLEMGEHSDQVHREVGKLAVDGADLAIFLEDDNGPYMAGVNGSSKGVRAGSHTEAARLLSEAALPGTAVLLKGSRGAAVEKVLHALLEETD